MTNGGYAWIVGTVVVLAALALSVALYRDEEATAAVLPIDHVRLMAGLLGLAAVAFAAASFFYWSGPDDIVGIPVPVGVAVVGALAIVLARVERV